MGKPFLPSLLAMNMLVLLLIKICSGFATISLFQLGNLEGESEPTKREGEK